MRKKNEWVVRVIWIIPERTATHHNCVPLLLEQLRYAGHVALHKDARGNFGEEIYLEGHRHVKYCFDIMPPTGADSHTWALANAERMRSFPINAVAAPRWVG